MRHFTHIEAAEKSEKERITDHAYEQTQEDMRSETMDAERHDEEVPAYKEEALQARLHDRHDKCRSTGVLAFFDGYQPVIKSITRR